MSLRSHVKQNARYALSGSWGRAIGIFFICVTIYIMFSLLRGMMSLLVDIPDFRDILKTPGYYLDDVPVKTVAALVMEALFVLAGLIVNAPLSLGVKQWYYAMAGGQPDDLSAIFSFFSRGRLFFRALWFRVSLAVRSVLWGILFFIVPGAVFAASWLLLDRGSNTVGGLLALLGAMLALLSAVFWCIFISRYFMAPYLLAEQTGMTARQAIKHSVREMHGGRTEIFLLELSFLPWALLCIFILPLLYVVPYYSGSKALYARYFIERARRDGTLPQPPEEHVPDDAALDTDPQQSGEEDLPQE